MVQNPTSQISNETLAEIVRFQQEQIELIMEQLAVINAALYELKKK